MSFQRNNEGKREEEGGERWRIKQGEENMEGRRNRARPPNLLLLLLLLREEELHCLFGDRTRGRCCEEERRSKQIGTQTKRVFFHTRRKSITTNSFKQ